eukprot:gene30988-37451_t
MALVHIVQRVAIYDLQLRISDAVGSLSDPSLASISILLLGGTLTSLSPCALGLLPITLSYLRGDASSSSSAPAINSYAFRVLAYAGGIVTAFTSLGVGAGLVGSTLAPVASEAALFKDLLVNSLYIFLGLNLLELSPVRLDMSALSRVLKVPRSNGYAGAYLYGITSALLGSACTTPVLAALLAYVSQTSPGAAASTLLLFSLGYVLPALLAGLVGRRLFSSGENAELINRGFAVIFLALGSYGIVHEFV